MVVVEIDPSSGIPTIGMISTAELNKRNKRRQNKVPLSERSVGWWIGMAVFLVAALVLYVVFSRLGWIQKLKNLGFRAGRRRV